MAKLRYQNQVIFKTEGNLKVRIISGNTADKETKSQTLTQDKKQMK